MASNPVQVNSNDVADLNRAFRQITVDGRVQHAYEHAFDDEDEVNMSGNAEEKILTLTVPKTSAAIVFAKGVFRDTVNGSQVTMRIRAGDAGGTILDQTILVLETDGANDRQAGWSCLAVNTNPTTTYTLTAETSGAGAGARIRSQTFAMIGF